MEVHYDLQTSEEMMNGWMSFTWERAEAREPTSTPGDPKGVFDQLDLDRGGLLEPEELST